MEYYKYIRQYIGHRPLMLVAGLVIIYKDNEILLQKRADDRTWAIHGGCMDLGETTEDTAIREAREETGLIVKNLKLLGVYSGKNKNVIFENGDECNFVEVVYCTDEFEGNPVCDKCEVTDLKWFNINSLPEELHEKNKEALNDFINKFQKNI